MKLFTVKSALWGMALTFLLGFGTFANTALADHNSHRHGQQQRYFHHDQKPRRYSNNRGNNRGGWHPGWRHSYSYQHQHKPRYRNRHYRGHQHGYRHGHSYRHGRHHNQYRGHVRYRGGDLVGALVGGAIIYHLGRELIRH